MIDLTETKLSLESSKTNPKYLVVDHDLVKTSEREEFTSMTRLPVEAGIFVETYEEALKAVKSNPNIVFGFIDIRIPKNQDDRADDALRKIKSKSLSSQIKDIKNEWGIKLLAQIKNIKTFVYSSHVDKSSLREEAIDHENVVGYSSKPFDFRDLQKIEPYLEKYFPSEKYVSISPSFDYSSLDEETSSFVQSKTREIKNLFRRAAEDVINLGNYLIEVKDRLGYGLFYRWLEAEFAWSSRTAVRFMRAAETFSPDTVAELDFLPSALYELSAPSAPEEAVTEAIERAKRGETIDKKTAIAIKAKYKALKEQAESKVKLKKVEQVEPERSENRESKLSVDSVSQPSSGLPEKRDKLKQEILAVVPSQNAVKNSWWQLGEHHRLFCGEPKNQEFLKRLPKDIGLSLTFLPKNDLSLVPSIESIFSFTFQSKYDDLDLDFLMKASIRTTTKPNEIVIFNYIYYIELLEVAEKLGCYFWVAEPDLEKCEQILTMWRKKGSVKRMNS